LVFGRGLVAFFLLAEAFGNNMLKAITCSLLMEQVLAPNFNFKTKRFDDEEQESETIKIKGFKEPSTERVKQIIGSDLNDLKAIILQDAPIIKALPGNVDPEVINKVMIPKLIKIKYPDLTDDEVEEVRQHVVVDSVIKNSEIYRARSVRPRAALQTARVDTSVATRASHAIHSFFGGFLRRTV
jgi:hypothetical protein